MDLSIGVWIGCVALMGGIIHADLGQPDDPVTIALFEFLKGK